MVVMMRATVNRGTAENRPKYQNAEYDKMIIIKRTKSFKEDAYRRDEFYYH